MSREITDEQLLQYLEGDLSGEETATMDRRIQEDGELASRLEDLRMLLTTMEGASEATPPEDIEWKFQAALREEMSQASDRSDRWGWRVAAAVVLLILGYAGGRLSGPGQSGDELMALQTEISTLRQVVMQTTLHTPSASERLQAVNLIEAEAEVNAPSPELLRTLLNTVRGDESPNVRYAAVQALEPYMDNEEVRLELTGALENQTDPLIQIAIINWLVEAEEQAAIGAIKDLINNENTTPEVKQQGQLAIDILI